MGYNLDNTRKESNPKSISVRSKSSAKTTVNDVSKMKLHTLSIEEINSQRIDQYKYAL